MRTLKKAAYALITALAGILVLAPIPGSAVSPSGASPLHPGIMESSGMVSADQMPREASEMNPVVRLPYTGVDLDIHDTFMTWCLGVTDSQGECYDRMKTAIFELVACVSLQIGWWKWALATLNAANPVGAATVVGLIAGYLVSRGLCLIALGDLIAAIDFCLSGGDSEAGDAAQTAHAPERSTFDDRWWLYSPQGLGGSAA